MKTNLQHLRDHFATSKGFKQAFESLGQESLTSDAKIKHEVIQALWKSSMSAVLLNNQMGAFFHTTVRICYGGFYSPVRHLAKILDDHHTSIFIGRRPSNGLFHQICCCTDCTKSLVVCMDARGGLRLQIQRGEYRHLRPSAWRSCSESCTWNAKPIIWYKAWS